MGQLGRGFSSRLVSCSVSSLSREGFRSDRGAAANLRTSLPGKVCPLSQLQMDATAPWFCTGTPFCCSAVSSGLKMLFASFSKVSHSSVHLLQPNCCSTAWVAKPQPLSLFKYLDISNGKSGGGCSFYMYTQIINNETLIPRRTPVSNHFI